MSVQETFIQQYPNITSSSVDSISLSGNEQALGALISAGNRAEYLEELGHIMLEWWMQRAEFTGGILYMYKPEYRHFAPLCWRGYPEKMAREIVELDGNEATFERLFSEKVLLAGRHQRPDPYEGALQKAFFSTITLPLACNTHKIGMLQLISERNLQFSPFQVANFCQLAEESAWLIKRIKAYEQNQARIGSFQFIFDYVGEAVLIMDDQGIVHQANQAALKLLGSTEHAVTGCSWSSILELDQPIHMDGKKEPIGSALLYAQVKNGHNQKKPVQIGITKYRWDEEDRFMMIIKDKIAIDQEPARNVQDFYRSIFDYAGDIICAYDQHGKILAVNPRGGELLGYDPTELVGRRVANFIRNGKPGDMGGFVAEKVHSDQLAQVEVLLDSARGEVLDMEFTIKAHQDPLGTTVYVAIGRDITERKRLENNLKYLSLHDGLTGLYNRHYFDAEMKRYESGEHDPIGIVICDIDGLKIINDTMGHLAGDEALKAGARLLKDSFRDGDVVARIGGDEFGVIMPRSNWNGVRAALRRLDRATEIYNFKNPQLQIRFSRGCAVRYARFKSLRETLREADDRMYHNKAGFNARSGDFTDCQTPAPAGVKK